MTSFAIKQQINNTTSGSHKRALELDNMIIPAGTEIIWESNFDGDLLGWRVCLTEEHS